MTEKDSGLGPSLELDEGLKAERIKSTTETQSGLLDKEYPPEVLDKIDREKKRTEHKAGVRSFIKIKETGTLDNQEIIEDTKGWAEGVGMKGENLSEVLAYYDLFPSIIDKDFPPEQRVEIACALAEIVSDPEIGIDAETLQALSYKIVYGGKSGTMDVVCEYSANFPSMKIYDELFKNVDPQDPSRIIDNDSEGVPQEVAHILKHEISHALIIYGGVGKSETMDAKLDGLIEDAQNLKARETYRVANAVEQYLAVVGKENVTQAEINTMHNWLKTEIRAEKIAAYLQSGGEFGGFLTALWKVLPPETAKKVAQDKEFRKSWAEENRVFFEEIQNDMADKANLKVNILKNSEAARTSMDAEDFEYEEMFEQSFKEGAVADNSKSPRIQSQTGSLWEATKLMFVAAAENLQGTIPIEELAKKEAT